MSSTVSIYDPPTVALRLWRGVFGLFFAFLWAFVWMFLFALLFFVVDDPSEAAKKVNLQRQFYGAGVTSFCATCIGSIFGPIVYSVPLAILKRPMLYSSLAGAILAGLMGIGLGFSLFHLAFSVWGLNFLDSVLWCLAFSILMAGIAGGCLGGLVINWRFGRSLQ